MGKIQLLDENVISKISAGEVIDGPYSVVRELIDNSIDAKSTKIIVNIIEGGKKLIEVIDNGEGMDKEDLEKCYLRHSTSKIRTIEDLYKITSMGFRGEALASISEVSEVEIISKPANQEEGYKITINGGKFISLTPHPSQDGTIVRVKNLFFNLPVRKNFLRSETTEFRNIFDVVIKKSIPFPEIHFEIIHNLKKEIILPKTNSLLERIKNIFPEIKELNYIRKTYDEMEIEIFFSKPSINRPTRNLQQLFVNKRYVESKTFLTAVSNAYSNLVPKGSYPIVFCFITIDPSLIDVNIHPAKKEIKFKNEGKLFHYIIQSIKEGIETTSQIITLEEDNLKFNEFEKQIKRSIEEFLTKKREVVEKPQHYKAFHQLPLQNPKTNYVDKTLSQKYSPQNNYQQSNTNQNLTPLEKVNKWNFIGTIFNTYLLFENSEEEKVLIIDQHAIHEKLIYSKLYKEILENRNLQKQILLAPPQIELSKDFQTIIKDNYTLFNQLGFEIELNENKITVKAIPTFFGKDITIEDSIIEICEKIKEGIEPSIENILEIVATISCRKAIKAGEKITSFEAFSLLEESLNSKDSFACPHGRPSMIILDKKTLESLFLRR